MVIKFKKVFGDAKIFYRIFPCEIINWDDIRVLENGKLVQIHNVGTGKKENARERIFKQFEADGILYNISQSDVYTTVMNGVIESVFQGQNAMIVAFGQTGSGKSSTIGGLHFFYKDRGLIPRCIEHVFSLKEQLPKNLQMDIEISYIEILSLLQARDLLMPYPAPVDKHNISKTPRKVKVMDDVDTLQHIFMAEGRKEYTSDTQYPSHIGSSIFTFHFTLRNMNYSDPYRADSKLHIIDLAGNDVFGDKASHFKQVSQVGTANCTKSYMEHFMVLLCGDDQELIRVKKRINIVSQYLGDSFSRDSILRFIGHLKTEKKDLLNAISMLRFGQLVKNLKPRGTTIILKDNDRMKAASLQAKLDAVVKDKTILEMLRNQEPKELCQERMKQIQRLVEEFMKNQIDEDLLLKLGDVKAIIRTMKEKIAACEEERAILNLTAHNQLDINLKKRDVSLSVQRSNSLKQKSINKSADAMQTQSVIAQSVNIKENGKTSNPKTSSQTKVHNKKGYTGSDIKATNKKSKMSTSSIHYATKRSSGSSKRKSVAVTESTASVEKSTKKTTTETQLTSSLINSASTFLPDVIPEHKESLKEYVLSEKTMYKSALETYKKQETDAGDIYQKYLRELKLLNSLFEILELRKNELMQSKFVGHFSRKQEVDDHGNIVRSEIEQRCYDNLKEAELNVSKQQEVVLNVQADLKITLKMRQQIKHEIQNEFEEFCKNKYNVPIPNLEGSNVNILENEVPMEEFCEPPENAGINEDFTQETIYVEIYKKLKKLMINETKKKMNFLKNSTKWIQNTQIPNE